MKENHDCEFLAEKWRKLFAKTEILILTSENIVEFLRGQGREKLYMHNLQFINQIVFLLNLFQENTTIVV